MLRINIIRISLIAGLALALAYPGLKSHAQNDKTGQIFACGATVLQETDIVSADQIKEGQVYSVTVTITNVGGRTEQLETNIAFRDPEGHTIDGSVGPTFYTLKPGKSITIPWQHGFGCMGRPKGEYTLGIGTNVLGHAVPCNDYWSEGPNTIGYHDVVLVNETVCPGFTP